MRTPIRLVLETTAVHTYPSLPIGELIAMLNDDGAGFGASGVALASTSTLFGEDELLKVPTVNAAFNGLDVVAEDWRRLGSIMMKVNDVAAAHAALVARDNDCLIATTCPELYADLDDPPLLVIEN